MSKIVIGSKIPSFTLKNQHNINFTIDSLVGKKNLVIYFYPKDETPGCTTEACNFRDQYKIFKEIDAEVIGISTDSPESHLKFSEKNQLPFILLSDPEDAIRKLFGVPNDLLGMLKGRVTYVVNKQGTVIHTFNSQYKPAQHIQEAINALYKI